MRQALANLATVHRIFQYAVGAVATIGLHLGAGILAGNGLMAGRDRPAEWAFYCTVGTCCLLPLTVTAAWLLARNRGTRHISVGAAVGLVVSVALVMVGLIAGYAPPWVTEGWTRDGWS